MTEKPVRQRETEAVFELLADSECRALLVATADSARTALELSDSCDIPSSTVYRKLKTLTNTALMEEGNRIRLSGNHVSEYRLQVAALRIDLTGRDAQPISCITGTHTGLESVGESDTDEVQTPSH